MLKYFWCHFLCWVGSYKAGKKTLALNRHSRKLAVRLVSIKLVGLWIGYQVLKKGLFKSLYVNLFSVKINEFNIENYLENKLQNE
jgi:hypothetical protein